MDLGGWGSGGGLYGGGGGGWVGEGAVDGGRRRVEEENWEREKIEGFGSPHWMRRAA